MVRKAVVCLLLILALAALPLRAGENVWTPAGPDTGTVTALAVHPADPRIVYAATDGGGVFKSTDGGESWRAANQGLGSPFVRALVIDPSAPGTLYAAIAEPRVSVTLLRVYRSLDGGATWSDRSAGLPVFRDCFSCGLLLAQPLVLDPRNPGALFTVVGGVIYRFHPLRERWLSYPGPGEAVLSLAFATDGTLYAGTETGVFKKPAGGAWTFANAGLGRRRVQALAVHPENPRILYAGTGFKGVFKSVDAGASWQPASEGLTSPVVLSLTIDPQRPSIVYAGTDAGLFRSLGARRWSPAGAGLPAGQMSAVAIAPSVSDVLYAGSGRMHFSGPGIFKSTDGGGTWQARSHGLNAGLITSFAVSWTLPQALYAGSNGQGVFRSDDGGDTWSQVNNGLTNLHVQALAIDPTDSRTVYAGTSNGLFKTTDGGASWTLRKQGSITEVAVDPEHPTTVFAASSREVFRSTDGGTTWQHVFVPPIGLEIQSLAAGPDSRVYLGAWSQHFSDELLWASGDGGLTWEAPATIAGGVFGLQVDPKDGDNVYAAIGSVLGRSLDGGTTWTYTQVPLGTTSVAVDPGDPEAVYTGSDFQGVWFQDGTASGPLGSGLVSLYVVALATDPLSPGTVYVAVRGGGVFRLDRR